MRYPGRGNNGILREKVSMRKRLTQDKDRRWEFGGEERGNFVEGVIMMAAGSHADEINKVGAIYTATAAKSAWRLCPKTSVEMARSSRRARVLGSCEGADTTRYKATKNTYLAETCTKN